MYKEHVLFETPENKDAKIWRYMDFAKFLSLLERESLYFARVDKLNDPFEGSYSKYNISTRPNVYNIEKEQLQMISKHAKKIREFTFINCWHISDNESEAMWSLYLKSNEGIAIQSTFKNLTESFQKCIEHDIFIGKVKYIDYDKDWLPEGNLFYPFLHKRLSFVHEQEIRALIMNFNDIPSEINIVEFERYNPKISNGIYIPIDIEILIEKIYISPTTPEWFGDLVKSIINRYKLNKEVIKSDLSKDPVY